LNYLGKRGKGIIFLSLAGYQYGAQLDFKRIMEHIWAISDIKRVLWSVSPLL